MIAKIKRYLIPGTMFLLSLLSALFWVALRVNYAGISKFLGADKNPSFLVMNLPIMVCVAAWIGVVLAVWGFACWEKRKWPAIAGGVIGLVMAVAAVIVVIFGAKDYLRFILPHFWESLAYTAGLLLFALVLFVPVRGWKLVKVALMAAVILVAVVIGYELRPCTLRTEAVVYAVEDDYQIVFATSDNAIGWVNIGGVEYYDLYAGSMQSSSKVHKITVPQSVLDEAGAYAINFRQMIYRGPFGGYLGEMQTRNYNFRPVDSSDGMNYYALSDVHEAVDAATAAAKAAGELDFIVLLGDLVSMVETEADALLANELAFKITGGEIPVIYARGNHEIKGEYAERLHNYVGAKGDSFHYTVTLGEELFAVVLDMGEDHEDDWWEYYGTAQFDIYRQQQTEMLEEILAEGEYEKYPYRLGLCHIPIVYVDSKGTFESFRNEWTALLNEMDIDMCLSGHKHVLWPFVPGQVTPGETLVYSSVFPDKGGKTEGGYLTDFRFTGYLVGRRSLQQPGSCQDDGYTDYVGLLVQVDFAEGIQSSRYVNCLGETLTCAYPFYEDTVSVLQTEICGKAKIQVASSEEMG